MDWHRRFYGRPKPPPVTQLAPHSGGAIAPEGEASGGSSRGAKSLTTEISNAQVKALAETPVELAPALEANEYYQVREMWVTKTGAVGPTLSAIYDLDPNGAFSVMLGQVPSDEARPYYKYVDNTYRLADVNVIAAWPLWEFYQMRAGEVGASMPAHSFDAGRPLVLALYSVQWRGTNEVGYTAPKWTAFVQPVDAAYTITLRYDVGKLPG